MTTKLQTEMLTAIARSEFQPINGAEPDSFDDLGWVWAEMIVETSQDKGTFASLVNAGLAQHNGSTGDDACVRLTLEGFQVYKSQPN